PEFVIWLVQIVKFLARAVWFVLCHPLLDLTACVVLLDYLALGWPGLAGTAGLIIVALAVLRLGWPPLFARFVTTPARDGWRYWFYRRRWLPVMTIAGLAPLYQGRLLLPGLAR